MTFEHKLLVGLEEIRALVLECTHKDCHARAVFAPDNLSLPTACPHGHSWDWELPRETFAGSPILAWVRLLGRLRDPLNQNRGFKILMEFDEPK